LTPKYWDILRGSRLIHLLPLTLALRVLPWSSNREDCLQVFQHADLVTSVDFHPIHDNLLVTGCFDRKIRVWDVLPEAHVASWVQAPEMVTAVGFSPDGAQVAAGLYKGRVFFYEFEGLRYYTQIECKNRHGQDAAGRKVTSVTFLNRGSGSSGVPSGGGRPSTSESMLLVTTNDSRIRLFQLDNYALLAKFKGISNGSMQIRGSFSEDGRYIICGSEDGHVVIWNNVALSGAGTGPLARPKAHVRAHDRIECSANPPTVITASAFAPSAALTYALHLPLPAGSSHNDKSSCDDNPSGALSLGVRVFACADYCGTLKLFMNSVLTADGRHQQSSSLSTEISGVLETV